MLVINTLVIKNIYENVLKICLDYKMECQFCKSVFSTKTSLNNHQKTAKYCLKLRDIKPETSYKCDGCGKTFSRSYHLQRHQKQFKFNDRLFDL